MRDDKFTTMAGIANLHASERLHWVMFVNEYYFDSYGFPPPLILTKHSYKGMYSEYQINKNNSYNAAYCLSILYLYLTHLIGFKNAVFNLYYRKTYNNTK